ERRAYDMHQVLDALVDDGSFFELKPLWAREIIIGFARLDGSPVGILANNPKHLGGVLFVDSADKAARFIWLCDAFSVPLAFLAERRAEYEEDVDLVHLAAELVVDAVVQPEDLRAELVRRLGLAASRGREDVGKRHSVPPV